MLTARPTQERFATKYRVDSDSGCWLWKGPFYVKGYGRFHSGSQSFRAHRASYMLHVGPIPDGIFVCHRCDVPACVNPAHLFLGTHQENMRDKVAKGRQFLPSSAITHCKRGHEFTPENTYMAARGVRHCRQCHNARERAAHVPAADARIAGGGA